MVRDKRNELELNLVGLVYDAALDPGAWPKFLAALMGAAGSLAVVMAFYDRSENKVVHFTSVGIQSPFRISYQDQFAATDPIPGLLPERKDDVYRAEDLMGPEQWDLSDYRREWLAPQGGAHQSGVVVYRDEGRLGVISLFRSEEAGAYTDEDLALLRLMQPHLSRAMQLNRKFWDTLSQPNAALSVLDSLEIGIILVDDRGLPVYRNRYADTVLRENSKLQVTGEGLRAYTQELTRELEQLVADVVRTGQGTGIHHGGWLALGVGEADPLFLLVSPLHGKANDLGLSGHRVCGIVFFSASDTTHALPIDALKEWFGLTPAECTLVRELDHGSTLEEIARSLGVSKHTVRDHLKSVFRKTGTRRQAELLRLVLTGPSSLIREADFLGISLESPLDRRRVADRRLESRPGQQTAV